MDYWSETVTRKSWEVLIQLTGIPLRFVLIGGWAAYLWSRTQKSKDVDIVLEDNAGLAVLKERFELKKNDRLRKYEIVIGEIDVDIYLPYYSRLALPCEELLGHATVIEGIHVVRPEALLILKQGAELARSSSPKGMKDRIDIMALLTSAGVDWKAYAALVSKHRLDGYPSRLRQIVQTFSEGRYLGLDPRRLRKEKERIIGELRKPV